MLEIVLAEAGFAFTTAGSGEDAISILEAERASFAALITDVNLSGKVTGWEVATRARELNEELPVVYITGGPAVHDWPSKGVPKSVLLPKPFANAQLVTAVSELITASKSPI